MYFFCFNNYYKCIVAKLFKRTALYIYNTAGPVTGRQLTPMFFTVKATADTDVGPLPLPH